MTTAKDITVLIATRNRADILRRTLEHISNMNLDGLDAEFVIIDNGSTDETPETVRSFEDRFNVRYLSEPEAGQNRARNRALREVELGEIVAFTDDDVKPDEQWLQEVKAISDRWPDCAVFGGRINPVWPDEENVPEWGKIHWIAEIGFAAHDHGDQEGPYKEGVLPFSPNMWFRRSVFENGRCFNEAIGPRPGSYIMGSETSFLQTLVEDGYKIVYGPRSVVGHYVQPKQISIQNMMNRGFRCGRQGPRLFGLCREELLAKHPLLWKAMRVAGIAKARLKYLVGMCALDQAKRVERKMAALIDLGYNVESLRVVSEMEEKAKETNA